MTSFLREAFLFLLALAALAMLMMIATANAAEPNQASDGTRQIVVEETTQDKGAASTDLTAESGAVPAKTLATETTTAATSEPATESDEAELTDRQALALAPLYALYLSTAHQGHRTSGYSYGYSYGRSYDHDYDYDHCDH